MVRPNKFAQAQLVKERADYLFMIYRWMGTARTIKRLAEVATGMGRKISVATLNRYSRDFGWQKELMRLGSVEAEEAERDILLYQEKMNKQHDTIAQGLMGIVVGGLSRYQFNMRRDQRALQDKFPGENIPQMVDLTPSELSTLYNTAQRGQRLARGLATSRIDIWVDIATTVVREFGLIFLSVNEIDDKIQRKAEYVRLADAMVKRYYSDESQQRIQITERGGS